ncbi:pyrroline-5-carboxylate reductase [Pseudoxanthomonas broegbernensis]|uniref:Pyrroline-5-carboxylate reductase n=1 Tax=Pseudoxanthomonas broegbernensis TaxID=83619 RepID=A0A7V8GP85_9GAMM|nr:pyrroline-5-carboxylate reductase [Pseudoxanthomonas broegbernensis]KAF1687472.1 pyrroline-5-carboxylate reductase [Pseudoxanthomonas broegbernensis]MBB6064472.1 pyrroline-5-carboxylate reductase [Pseudoxanthomonas broegbernensis]
MTHSPSAPGRIAFLGGGNMARSLIGGLAARGTDTTAIHVAEPVEPLRQALAADFGVQAFADAADAVRGADLWVLSVKPQVMGQVCESVAAQAQATRPLVVSIAAGIPVARLQQWLGGGLPVVRCMPNTPALLGAGVTGLFAGAGVDADRRARADAVLASAGATVWIEHEPLMDAVTAVSGSGPAYVFLLAEAMQAAAEAEGLPAAQARTLVVQTLLGAGRMLAESGEPAAELRRRVTSPGGTTQAAIEAFQAGGFEALVATAVHAARVRGAELAAG